MTNSQAHNSGDSIDAARRKKNHDLFLRQKALLDLFLSNGALTKAQYDKSFGDLKEKMGEE